MVGSSKGKRERKSKKRVKGVEIQEEGSKQMYGLYKK